MAQLYPRELGFLDSKSRLKSCQSVCRGVKFTLELVSRYYFLSESCCVVSLGTLSDDKSGLSHVSHCKQYLVHCQKSNIIYIVLVKCFIYMQYILDLCQHRLCTADHAKVISQ
jgi:hypothetical protein